MSRRPCPCLPGPCHATPRRHSARFIGPLSAAALAPPRRDGREGINRLSVITSQLLCYALITRRASIFNPSARLRLSFDLFAVQSTVCLYSSPRFVVLGHSPSSNKFFFFSRRNQKKIVLAYVRVLFNIIATRMSSNFCWISIFENIPTSFNGSPQ